MLNYIIRRVLLIIPTLFIVSLIAFVVIDLPEGDYIDSYVASLEQSGADVTQEAIDSLRRRYGLDQPLFVRYSKWIGGIVLRGDWGFSFAYAKPVAELIGERMVLTVALAFASIMLTWIVGLPIGIYSAVKQYSLGDYVASFLGFVGVAVPGFLIALIVMYLAFRWTGYVVGGLFSPEYVQAPWSLGRVLDLFKRLWVPAVIVGLSGVAGTIRTTRANLLDELHRPYVVTARSKGLPEGRVIIKYPVRMILNPFVSGLAFLLPNLISSGTIVANVLSLPTTGPMYLSALQQQDSYLAGSFVLLLSTLTLIGTLISDILLAWVDPRIRMAS
jgi:peptide/nickel transport system permease protein